VLDVYLFLAYKYLMHHIDYKKAYEAARAETDTLMGQRAIIDARLAQLKGTMDALSALMDEPPGHDPSTWYGAAVSLLAEVGISDAIRQILSESTTGLSAPEIKKALARGSFGLEQYSNPLAVIHNTLARLEKQGEITRYDLPSGTVYGRKRAVMQPPPNFGANDGMTPPPEPPDPVEDSLRRLQGKKK